MTFIIFKLMHSFSNQRFMQKSVPNVSRSLTFKDHTLTRLWLVITFTTNLSNQLTFSTMVVSFILLLLLRFPSRMSCYSSFFSWSPSFSWLFMVLSCCSYSSLWLRFFFFVIAILLLLPPLFTRLGDFSSFFFLPSCSSSSSSNTKWHFSEKKTHTNHQSVWFIW